MKTIATKQDLHEAIEYAGRNVLSATAATEKQIMLCITKAQEFNDVELEFSARIRAISILNNRHKRSLAISMFPWLLKKCDEDRERFDYDRVLSIYLWIVCYSKQHASVSKARLLEMWDDFERRMREAGSGDKIIHLQKFYFHAEMGETALAEEELKLYESAVTTGRFDGCKTCDPLELSFFLMSEYRYEALLEMVMPVVRGEITCHLSERYHLHMGMIAAMMLGRWEEAEHLAQRSIRHLDYDIAILFPFSSHLVYYGVTEQFGKGRQILEKQLPYAFDKITDMPKRAFLIGALVFFTRLKDSGRKTIRMDLPANKLLYSSTGIYKVESCIAFCREQVGKLSSALDKRNGNSYFTQRAQELLDRYCSLQQPAKTA